MKRWKPVSTIVAAAFLASCDAGPTQAPAQGVRSTTALSVSIFGPTQVQPGVDCLWEALPSGGTPPYSYMWMPSTGGSSGDVTSSVFGYAFENGPHFLRVQVTDATSTSVQTTISVWANNGTNGCP